MSGPTSSVFVARLVGLPLYDPGGDRVGKVRDVVTTLRLDSKQPRALGLVVEVSGRRRSFLPMTRVLSVDLGHVAVTGLVNLRRFAQRPTETLVVGELFDREVTILETGEQALVYDVALEQSRGRDWFLSRLAVQRPGKRFRRGPTAVLEWGEVRGLAGAAAVQGATHMLATLEAMRPADLAAVLHDLSGKRRHEVALALDDQRLADVLEELPEGDQVEILAHLDGERAADVLEEMSPDDAADLVAELPPERAEQLLTLMSPDDADDVRRLLTYEDDTAGGLMTSEPVILGPDDTVADALAQVRIPELTPALAALVAVCRPPLETPTGRYLGIVHIQRLLREPPSELVSGLVDDRLEPLRPEAPLTEVAAHLAAYNLVAYPVVDEQGHLLGVVTVDDVLDHLLPADWRGLHPAGLAHGAAADRPRQNGQGAARGT